MSALEVEEIYLDLTYGQIRGKWWGSRQRRPILLVHGWQDNAGSFDTLIPLLPQNLSYLAIDNPGHGFSSWLPKGISSFNPKIQLFPFFILLIFVRLCFQGCGYHCIDLLPILEEIRIKLKWERISLIAHSMGAIASFFYASLYPDQVDLVCALDTLKMQHHHPQYTEKLYTWRTKQLIALNAKLKDDAPEYEYDELVRRVFEGSMQSVNVDKAKYLIGRGARPLTTDPNKFAFTRDVRVKFTQPFFVEQNICMEYIKQIRCAYLFVRGEDRLFSEPEKNVRESIQQFRKYNKHFELIRVRGTHHFHLNEPEQFAEKLGAFLQKHYVAEEQASFGMKLVSKL